MASPQTGKSRTSTRKAPPAAPTPKSATPKVRKAAPKPSAPAISSEDWRALVAAAAYFRAEARGFVGGSAEEDWLEAEKEVAARLAAL